MLCYLQPGAGFAGMLVNHEPGVGHLQSHGQTEADQRSAPVAVYAKCY